MIIWSMRSGKQKLPRSPLLPCCQILFLACLGSTAAGCYTVPPGKAPAAATRKAATRSPEEGLSDLLRQHAVNTPLLAHVSQTLESTLRDALAPLVVAPINAERVGDEVILYIIDSRAAFQDERTCGGSEGEFAVPASRRAVCRRVRSTRFNCAVVASRTLACDYRLLCRLARYALVAALASLKEPGSRKPSFDRNWLRDKLITRELDQLDKQAALEKLAEVERLAGQTPEASEPFARLWAGFAEYLISHEAGHIYHGHVSWGASPPCATDPTRTLQLDSLGDVADAVCARESPLEQEADTFAIHYLAQRILPDRFTGARASPELFMEEFERRTRLAMLDLGHDIETWRVEQADPSERNLFTAVWMVRLATAGHPQDLRRYIRLLEALEARGVPLQDSRESRELAAAYLKSVEKFCHDHKRLAPWESTP